MKANRCFNKGESASQKISTVNSIFIYIMIYYAKPANIHIISGIILTKF